MRYEAGKLAADGRRGALVLVLTPEGERIPAVHACDTEEKWIEQYQLNAKGRLLVENHQIAAPVRIKRNFKLQDRLTGEVFCEVRR